MMLSCKNVCWPFGFIFRASRKTTLSVLILLMAAGARADEGGVSFWMPGQYGSFAAIAPEPGFSMPLVTNYYSGDASGDQLIEKGRNL